MKQHFVMLAHKFKDEVVSGWYMSTKLDGMRCIWDGGITKGLDPRDVPWANTTKDDRYVNHTPVCSGLWSRYGHAIQAPIWWLERMPKGLLLDGELYMGRKTFQQLMSTVKQTVSDDRWKKVMYHAFDSPPVNALFANREIDEPNANYKITDADVWVRNKNLVRLPNYTFCGVLDYLNDNLEQNEYFTVHSQIELSYSSAKAMDSIHTLLQSELAAGGEGLILRKPKSYWTPSRVRTLLKVKGMEDAEATVVGYVAGRETDKGSKLLGMMGALIVNFNGKIFELSGFTDTERRLTYTSGKHAYDVVAKIPGERVPAGIENARFPIGSRVTFQYREVSDTGIPKEARYWRKYAI